MIIKLSKFGTTLTSRQTGKEAYAAFSPTLKNVPKKETIEIDFEGVNTFSPSWGDEFLTGLIRDYKDRVRLRRTDNLSVKTTIEMLEQVNGYKFAVKI